MSNRLGELIPCGGGDPIPLFKHVLLIGRRDRCDITLTFPNISSQHCELVFKNGYWEIRDLNSRNGIKVNDERCDSKWLMPGDTVAIAKHRYTIQYEPDPTAPPPEEENVFEMSLMEKSGLAQREERPRSRPTAEPEPDRQKEPPVRPASGSSLPSDEDEDEALKWLNDVD